MPPLFVLSPQTFSLPAPRLTAEAAAKAAEKRIKRQLFHVKHTFSINRASVSLIKRHSYPRNTGFGARLPRSPRATRPRSPPPQKPPASSPTIPARKPPKTSCRTSIARAPSLLSPRALIPPDASLSSLAAIPALFVSRETPLFQPNSTPRRPFRPSSPIKQPQTPRKAAHAFFPACFT